MTPEESQLVRGLFDRLAQLEREPRDAEAERLIREGLARAPNAVYALVQTVLLQEEALRSANEHITSLEDELARAQQSAPPQSSSGSFLGERGAAAGGNKWNTGAVLGGSVPPTGGGSVPSVGGARGDQPMGAPPGYGGDRGYPGGDPYGQPTGRGPMPGGPGSGPWQGGPGGGAAGGGFLGTAAAVAAGAIGGSLLMSGIRSALAGQGDKKGPMQGALEQLGGKNPSPETGGGNLAGDAGVNDIGRSRQSAMQQPDEEEEEEGDEGDEEEYEDDDFDHDDMQDSYDDDQ